MNPSVQVKSDQNGTKLIATTIIDAPQTAVWDILKYPGKVAKFHPLIKKSYMTTEAQNGMGAKRHCDLLPMGEFNEVITEWEEGNAFTIEVTDGKMLPPHHFMKGRFALEKREAKTLVTFSFSYRLKYGLLGKVMDVLFVRPQFKKAPPQYVIGLKRYVEQRQTTSAG